MVRREIAEEKTYLLEFKQLIFREEIACSSFSNSGHSMAGTFQMDLGSALKFAGQNIVLQFVFLSPSENEMGKEKVNLYYLA